MSLTQRAPPVNRLLEALPSSDLRRLLAECETVELAFTEAPLSHAAFFTTTGTARENGM